VGLTTILIEAREKGVDLDKAVKSFMSWDELAQERDEAQALTRPVNYDYIDLIKPKYSYLRQYTPTFLNEMKFQSNHAASSVQKILPIVTMTYCGLAIPSGKE
jgi:hypothetical protein